MTRTELIALAHRVEHELAEGDLADFLRQLAESKPVGTVAQHSYEQHQSVYYGNGNVTPWTLKRPHAAPMLFCELVVGTALYTLPLED